MKRIFITGASGCIGHYITETLIQNTEHELFLLVRNPDKIQFNCQARPGIHILKGDMSRIEEHSDLLLKKIDVAILAATAWGGTAETYDINVVKTLALIKMLNPSICERVIYFSTASILDRQNQLLLPASQFGHDYIRTKYQCFSQLNKTAIADKIISLFPTLVFGGDQTKPYSHLTSGLPEIIRWMGLIRWLKVDGSFHFIHARDIAWIVRFLIENPEYSPEKIGENDYVDCLVLGNAAVTVNDAIAEICHYVNKRMYFGIPLNMVLINLLIKIFRIRMDSWSRFSLDYRHFTYQNPATPQVLGGQNYCSSVGELMKVSGIESN